MMPFNSPTNALQHECGGWKVSPIDVKTRTFTIGPKDNSVNGITVYIPPVIGKDDLDPQGAREAIIGSLEQKIATLGRKGETANKNLEPSDVGDVLNRTLDGLGANSQGNGIILLNPNIKDYLISERLVSFQGIGSYSTNEERQHSKTGVLCNAIIGIQGTYAHWQQYLSAAEKEQLHISNSHLGKNGHGPILGAVAAEELTQSKFESTIPGIGRLFDGLAKTRVVVGVLGTSTGQLFKHAVSGMHSLVVPGSTLQNIQSVPDYHLLKTTDEQGLQHGLPFGLRSFSLLIPNGMPIDDDKESKKLAKIFLYYDTADLKEPNLISDKVFEAIAGEYAELIRLKLSKQTILQIQNTYEVNDNPANNTASNWIRHCLAEGVFPWSNPLRFLGIKQEEIPTDSFEKYKEFVNEKTSRIKTKWSEPFHPVVDHAGEMLIKWAENNIAKPIEDRAPIAVANGGGVEPIEGQTVYKDRVAYRMRPVQPAVVGAFFGFCGTMANSGAANFGELTGASHRNTVPIGLGLFVLGCLLAKQMEKRKRQVKFIL